MSVVPLESTPTTTVISGFLTAAAELELRVHDAEAHAEILQRDLQQLRQRHDQIRNWIRAIRRWHRSQSHHATSGLIRRVVASLEADAPAPVLTMQKRKGIHAHAPRSCS